MRQPFCFAAINQYKHVSVAGEIQRTIGVTRAALRAAAKNVESHDLRDNRTSQAQLRLGSWNPLHASDGWAVD